MLRLSLSNGLNNMSRKYLYLVWCWLVFLPLNLSAQQIIKQTITDKSPISQARYIEGDANKPAILILHGFLATRDFSTVTNLQNFLSFQGYPTLAPTLSLGIPLRAKSLSCDSLHTHTLDQDIAEIQGWIHWLEQTGHDQILLIGHSSGSQQLLEALAKHRPATVKAVFLTSLYFVNSESLGIRAKEIQKAKLALKTPNSKPEKYNFLYCQNDYFASAESFLSYMVSTPERVISLLNESLIPTYSIMGGADARLKLVHLDWLIKLEQTPTKLVIIEGANHFFSHDHEPTLHQTLIQLIEQLMI